MRNTLLLVAAGSAIIAIAINGRISARRSHEKDVRDVALLRVRLDSTRRQLTLAATAADSARLTENIALEAEGISFREYHVVMRQSQPRSRWAPWGTQRTSMVAVGATLVLIGGVLLLRRRRAG